jgi:hypothetical protein
MTDITGWVWIVAIIAFFAVSVWLLIRVSFQLERRDRRRGRRDLDEGGNVFNPNDGAG